MAKHQTISMELSTILNTYIKSNNGACRVFHTPFDVKLNDQPLTIVQPGLMIICDKNKLDGKRCNGAPDFIIEIVSPGNPSDDYIRKLYYYKNAGVREYWIVDPRRKTVTVNYFEGNFQTQLRVFRPLKAKNHTQYPGTSETVWAHYSSWCGKFELNIQYSFDAVIKVNIYQDLLINFSEIDQIL